ncbi:D-alanine--D-alanine ligase family protein [Virgibacillus chiguensis]|uniref:D-alanine--D-alanine ligase n=1 Tax=Virgibacillus chiguensis TaxID=411959 RepID=A0A1M5TNW4_9BACI|nr:D-alanine--D-alanine ligase family protein [Virgibacillus chiguensis]SHH52378.1 D-alanine-D-alanine ligase [Virgibacillus chiguensis]
MSKLNVGLLFGGESREHEVSLQSASNVAKALDVTKFNLIPIAISKDGKWLYADSIDKIIINQEHPQHIELDVSRSKLAIFPGDKYQFMEIDKLKPIPKLDVIFSVLHGGSGENGSMNGLFNILRVPCVGSSLLSSAICMDKDLTKKLLRYNNVKVANYVSVTKETKDVFTYQELKETLGEELFIKPNAEGSSIGVHKVTNEQEFTKAVANALLYDEKILIEERIIGKEIECAVLGNQEPEASTTGEITFDSNFYSYEAKYISSSAAKISIPSSLSECLSSKVAKLSIDIFKILGCKGLARIDFFITESKEIYVNEINALPGFTNISMYPKLWEFSGVKYKDLITKLIMLALDREDAL